MEGSFEYAVIVNCYYHNFYCKEVHRSSITGMHSIVAFILVKIKNYYITLELCHEFAFLALINDHINLLFK